MTDYKQAFLFSMDNGDAVLSVVMAPSTERGRQLAENEAMSLSNCDAWDGCAYPVTDGVELGVRILTAS